MTAIVAHARGASLYRYFLLIIILGAQADAAAKETSRADEKVLTAIRQDSVTSMLFWTHEQQVVGFRNIARLLPTRQLQTGDYIYPLVSTPRDFSDVHYELEGKSYSVADFMNKLGGAGILVLRDDEILFERYANGHDADSLWVSFSVAKSVTSMLVGAAIQDGFISNVDEPITDYLPRLKGSAYDKASIRDVLQMASGVAWNEDYADPESDVAIAGGLSGTALYGYLANLPSDSKPGIKFNYNTGETNLVGALVRAAIGNNLATYATKKIWQAFGMGSDANWLLNHQDGSELGGCCISATLRDYARIGLFALNGGVAHNGERILPENWMQQSTTASQGYEGYGYLWWLGEDSYSALGIYGQSIFIHPATRTIIAMHNVWPEASAKHQGEHRTALISALLRHLGQP